MANNLMPLLRAGERVLHHVPEGRLKPNWRTWLAGMAAFGILALLVFWITVLPAKFGALAVAWSIFWAIITILVLLDGQSSETMVTERRVLHVEDRPTSMHRELQLGRTGPVLAAELKLTEVKLDDVASVMALGQSVHITKSDGTAVFIKHANHASDIAAALARTTALAPPRTPLKMRIAVNVVLGALALGWGTGLGDILRFTPEPDALVLNILRTLLAIVGAVPAGVAAEFLAVAALRSVLGRNELRACVQEAGVLLFAREDPNSPNAFTRFSLRFVDWLYRRAPTLPQDRSGT